MKDTRDVLVVVMGYGCHLTESMKGYLDFVGSFVRTGNVKAIIVTGGFTNRKSAPGVSEAKMMCGYLREQGVTIPIFLEETAVTTNQNLQRVAKIIDERHLHKMRVVIFCDSARWLKIKILGRLILGYWPEIRTYELTKGFIPKIKQLFIATPLDILALRFLFIEKMQLERKERIMNNS